MISKQKMFLMCFALVTGFFPVHCAVVYEDVSPFDTANSFTDCTAEEVYWSDIKTIISSYSCTACHGAIPLFGSYSLDSYANALGGGTDSEANVVADDPWASFLFVKAWGMSTTYPPTDPPRGDDSTAVAFSGVRMPQGCSGDGCLDANQAHQIQIFCWIAQGAREAP